MILANIFTVFVVYIFFYIFIPEKRKNIINMLLYSLYSILTIISALYIDIPIVNLIITIVTVTAIALSYKIEYKKALLLIAFYCFILFIGELISGAITGRVFIQQFIKTEYENLFGLFFYKLIIFIMIILLQNLKFYKRNQSPPLIYTISILLIPSSSIGIAAMIMSIQEVTGIIVLFSMRILILINILSFILYNKISVYYEKQIENVTLKQENLFYHNQLESMNKSLKETRAIRHDIQNHFNMIEGYLKYNKTEEAVLYLKNLRESEILSEDNIVNTGNFVVDSILNYKLSSIQSLKIQTELEIFVPETIKIDTVYFVTILTNLLDNAIDALRSMQISSAKILRIRIAYTKGRLMIFLQNSYEGDIIYESGNICSTKENSELHGLGLKNVRKALESYNGLLKITHNSGVFLVQALLYLG